MPALQYFPLFALVGCVAAGDAPIVQALPAVLDLGAVRLGEAGVGELTLVNQGAGIARIGAISLANGSDDAWALASADTTDLYPGATSRIEVTYTPTEEGLSQARLEILSDDSVHPVLEVPLLARGVQRGNGDGVDTGDVGAPTFDDDGDGYTEEEGDCDDGDPATHPGAGESCEDVDRDCSGTGGDVDADGDGHSPCDVGGDCDDADPAAWPVVVAVGATAAPDGTVAAPYATVDDALDHLDTVCRTIVLLPGTHTASVSLHEGPLTVRGGGADASAVVVTPPEGDRAFEVSADGRLALDRLTLQGARPSNVGGGALHVEGGTALLTDVRAIDNHSVEDGGAISVVGGTLTLLACVLEGNTAGDDGGALDAADDATVVDHGSRWSGNTSSSGGAVNVRDADLTVDGASFLGNAADGGGGAVRLRGGTVTVERTLFRDNAAGWRGGAVYLDDETGGTLRNLLVVGNRADREGGGLAVAGAPEALVVANNTFVGNDAGGSGGGVFVDLDGDHEDGEGDHDDAASVYLGSNIVAWSGGTSGVWAALDRGTSVAYTLAYGNAGADLDLAGGTDAGGNLVGDPLFERWSDDGDATNDLLTPGPSSPAVDAGPTDGEGPWGYQHWGDADGTRNDRGYTGGPGAG